MIVNKMIASSVSEWSVYLKLCCPSMQSWILLLQHCGVSLQCHHLVVEWTVLVLQLFKLILQQTALSLKWGILRKIRTLLIMTRGTNSSENMNMVNLTELQNSDVFTENWITWIHIFENQTKFNFWAMGWMWTSINDILSMRQTRDTPTHTQLRATPRRNLHFFRSQWDDLWYGEAQQLLRPSARLFLSSQGGCGFLLSPVAHVR